MRPSLFFGSSTRRCTASSRMVSLSVLPSSLRPSCSGRAFYVADPPRVESDGRDGGVHCGPSYCERIKAQVLEWKAQQTHGGLGKVRIWGAPSRRRALCVVHADILHSALRCLAPRQAFFFVDRGVCTFAAKVAVAEGCGADAVIVVDHGSQNWSRETIQHNVVMSDDGQVGHGRPLRLLLGCAAAKAFLSFLLKGA